MRTLRALGVFTILLAALLATAAQAQDNTYPSRAIRIVVPYPPGAITDSLSRAFAAELGKALGQTVVVENKPGAGTALGTQTVKQAPADGYTILFNSDALISVLSAMKDPGYQLDDFKPVAMLGDTFFVLMTPSAFPAKTLREFVDYARANPKKLNYASLGVGGVIHRTSERFGRIGKFEWESIQYRGGAPAYQAVMTNEVQGYFTTVNGALMQKASEKFRLLAIAADTRSEFLAEVPTFKELGYDGMVDSTWTALFVRSETPPAIIEKLRRVSAEIMMSDNMKKHLRMFGMSPPRGTIDAFAASFPDTLERLSQEMKLLGIQPQ